MQGVLVSEAMTQDIDTVTADMPLLDLEHEFATSHHHGPVAQQMPRYDITFILSPTGGEEGKPILRGSQSVHILNPGPDPWPHLIFRLYPMLKQYDGNFSIGSMAVDGQPKPVEGAPKPQ